MKKLLLAYCLTVFCITPAFAVTKCESDNKGGICCWDTERDGPFKPLSCL